jgi:hypothetical protein
MKAKDLKPGDYFSIPNILLQYRCRSILLITPANVICQKNINKLIIFYGQFRYIIIDPLTDIIIH